MLIKKIIIDSYRNIDNIEIELEKNNLIIGKNGSGKTNVLDAFYQLGYGKSFHISKNKYLIKDNKDAFTIYADIINVEKLNKVAISKNKKGIKTSKINGKKISKQSDISINLPIIAIVPESLKSLTGSNTEKRAFINLCMFHVEPLFLINWKKYNQLLKQRNKALKTKSFESLSIWDSQLNESSELLTNQIASLLTLLSERLNFYCEKMIGLKGFSIKYNQGWEEETALIKVFENTLANDIKYGFTTKGIHRYKINYLYNDKEVENVFSRAQCKLFAYSLYLSLVDLLKNKPLLLLLDDPLSELDIANCDKIFSLLEKLDVQKIISTSIPPININKTFKVFHVEHGSLTNEQKD